MYGLPQFTMAPPKQPPKTIAAAKADGNTLLTDLFKRGRRVRPKRVANLAGDVIAVASEKEEAQSCSKAAREASSKDQVSNVLSSKIKHHKG